MTLPAAVLARVTPAMDRIYLRPLSGNPERNARETLQAINALIRDGAADPLVRQQAAQIVGEAGARGHRDALEAVHAWVQRHMPYVRDPGEIELLTSAPAAIRSIQQRGSYIEDCDGQVIVEASLVRALLGPAAVRTVIIKADRKAPTQWSHIFLQARVGSEWITLDPIMNGETAKRPKQPVGWHPPKYFAREFVPVGEGPTLPALAAQTQMAAYERGGDGMGDWIPAARSRGNAMAREDDSWFEELPILANDPAPSGISGWGRASYPSGRTGIGAVMSNTYAQQRDRFAGLGAIESHAYAQGPMPGYRPTTVAEDPHVVAGTAFWAGMGTVGGTVRTHGVKTSALSGVADYIQLGHLGDGGADLAKTIIEQAAQIATLAQTQALNTARARAGLPPVTPGGGAPEAETGGGSTMLMIGAAAVGLGVLALWAMRRRRKAA